SAQVGLVIVGPWPLSTMLCSTICHLDAPFTGTKIPSRVAHRWTRWPNQTSRNSDKGWTHLNYSSYGIAFTRTTLSYLAGKGIAKASWTRRRASELNSSRAESVEASSDPDRVGLQAILQEMKEDYEALLIQSGFSSEELKKDEKLQSYNEAERRLKADNLPSFKIWAKENGLYLPRTKHESETMYKKKKTMRRHGLMQEHFSNSSRGKTGKEGKARQKQFIKAKRKEIKAKRRQQKKLETDYADSAASRAPPPECELSDDREPRAFRNSGGVSS
ncbi:unnamed protein product, partial [Durusdinium trenchii]